MPTSASGASHSASHTASHTSATSSITAAASKDGGSSGGGLSTGTIIAIAVACGSVGILILTLFLWRLISRFFRPKVSNPLPPVQPLAHIREAQLAAFERNAGRPATWLDPTFTGHSRHFLHSTASDVSLIPGTPDLKTGFYGDEATTAESSSSVLSPLEKPDDTLPPPNPNFLGNRSSVHSSVSSNATASSALPSEVQPAENGSNSPPMTNAGVVPSESQMTTASSELPLWSLHSETSVRQSPSRTDVRPPSRAVSRPSSVASFGGTNQTLRSIPYSGRGTPHGPRSNVQIVLPTPLAPQVYPYMQPAAERSRSSAAFNVPSARSSVFVDQWVSVGTASPVPSNGHGNHVKGERRASWASSNRGSKHGQTSHSPSRRAHSQTRNIPESSVNASGTSDNPPPLPRLPSRQDSVVQPESADTDDLEPRRFPPEQVTGSDTMQSLRRSFALAQEYERSTGPPPPKNLPTKGRTLRKPKPDNVS